MAGVQGYVQNILHGGVGTTELLQSYVRGDETDDDTESEAPEKGKIVPRGIGIGVSPSVPLIGSLLSSAVSKQDIYSPVRKDSSNENDLEKQQVAAVNIPATTKKAGAKQGAGKRGSRRRRTRKKRQNRAEELYTDKDRAAAVNMGSKDIKHSLSLKLKQDRSEALQIPVEAEPGTFMALGVYEMKNGDVKIARGFLSKALEMNEDDREALLARSRCHIMLGDAKAALEDATAALKQDKNDIESIYQKAEALYALGHFEHSLMYYHRGLRLRPEMVKFRLGIQKAQKSIMSTIGPDIKLNPNRIGEIESEKKPQSPSPSFLASPGNSRRSSVVAKVTRFGRFERASEEMNAQKGKKYLGPLAADQIYLEKLLNDPHTFKCLGKENVDVVEKAEEALSYLRKRQIFWQRQVPATSIVIKRKAIKRFY